MKKILIISAIVLVVIVGLFENIGEDIPEEADTKTEETNEAEEKEAQDKAAAEKEQAEKEKAEKEKAEKEKAEAERVAKEQQEKEEKAAAEKAAKEKAEQEATEQANAEETFLQIMRDSVGSYVDIQFDEDNKTYTMTPTDQGLIDEISMLSMGVGHEDWGVLVDGMASLSKSGKDLVGEGYTMTLVNPLNHENILLWIVDGEVIYNVIDDL